MHALSLQLFLQQVVTIVLVSVLGVGLYAIGATGSFMACSSCDSIVAHAGSA